MENKKLIEERSEIQSRVMKGEKVKCPECGELLYFVRDWGEDMHPGVYCPNGHFKTMMTMDVLDKVDKEMWGQVGKQLKIMYNPKDAKVLIGKEPDGIMFSAEAFNRLYGQNVSLPVQISEHVEEGTYEIFCEDGVEVHKIGE